MTDFLADISHPAQLHMFRPVLEGWKQDGFQYVVASRDKDITLTLMKLYGIEYVTLSSIGRGKFGLAKELIGRDIGMFRLAGKKKPKVYAGTSVNAAHVAWLRRKPSFVMTEDDAKYVRAFRWLAYPFASALVTPVNLAYEDYGKRHLTYPSYQKLFYLHPNRFTPDVSIRGELGVEPGEPYALVRLSALNAYHDTGVQGVSREFLRRTMDMAGKDFRFFISSEKPLDPEFEPYRLSIPIERAHHALAFADLFIGDSQSMTMEAALLGTPAFRINSFAGQISVIDEIEKHGLAWGFLPSQTEEALSALKDVFAMEGRKEFFREKQQSLLAKKIDPVPWFLQITEMAAQGEPMGAIKAWSDKQFS